MNKILKVTLAFSLAVPLSVAGVAGLASADDTTPVTPVATPSATPSATPTADPTSTPAPETAVTVNTVTTPTATSTSAPTTYVVNAWKLGPLSTPANYDASTINSTNAFTDQQKEFKEGAVASTVDLNSLDSQLAAGACYQIDGYINDATTTSLVAGGVLNSPDHPAEDLAYGAPGVDGNPWKFICVPPAPVSCTAAVNAPWTNESGDLAPVQGTDGVEFNGANETLPSGQAIDLYTPVSGNIQGIGSIEVVESNTHGYTARAVIEVNPHTTLSYETLSVASEMHDGLNVITQSTLVYSSKLAYSAAGGQGNPEPLSWFATNQPNNTLDQFGIHLQTGINNSDVTANTSTVSSFEAKDNKGTVCVSKNWVPAPPTTPSVPTTVKTGNAPFNPEVPAGLALLAAAMLLLGAGLIRKARTN